ncbi:transposase ISPpu9 [Acidocella aminolytica 101 = DSM 11237]|uniref:Transposase ISPpu9 n=2 Tax=Acidocella TaxID=50709 RepID=A0A0D6PLT7_9PROT|nr:transposase ISPpu9 [Acidocella aminolytica 101 = DSM 11237]
MGACELESGDTVSAVIPIRKMIDWHSPDPPQRLMEDFMPNTKTSNRPELKIVNIGAAAIDIGSKMHMAAVNPACADTPVRAFGTFTQDLHDLADWFKACGVTSVAMESTGVYWIPVYEILEQRGFDVILVNVRYAKNVPGRKTDVNDASWLCQLHSYGLLRGSFRPDAEIATLRAYLRQRERLVEYAAAHTQHMQKALMEMNLQLHHVVSDITGATGMQIIRAMVAGERDPDVLASYRDVRCHSSTETLRAALVGNDRDEHVFALAQALELYDTYQAMMLACDGKLQAVIATLSQKSGQSEAKLPKARVRTKQVNAPCFDVRAALFGLLGIDLTQIHGLGPALALKLVGECGTDLKAWPTAKHFTSWLCLAPGNKISGGKVLSSRTRRSSSRAAALLRLAATTIGRSDTALGAFYRRLSSRAGKAKAVTATARKIAVLFYNALRHGMNYHDPGADRYEAQYRSRVVANLQRRAKSLGFVLQATPIEVEVGVS